MRKVIWTAAVSIAACGSSFAQFNNRWVEFAEEPARLAIPVQALSNPNDEVDFAWGDLDRDGWIDVVAVVKQDFTSTGKRPNTLLMNEFGVLQDRTAQYAASSDVPGDMGFLTPTNDRDVILVDLDLDGWLDVVTAPTLSDGDPKHIGHPRIYMNRGNAGNGSWLGLRHEDGRAPQMFVEFTNVPANPRFCSVSAGDVTGNGYPDLYFGDYDSGGGNQSLDMNDRLWINDGAANFTDESFSRMTFQMRESAFGMAVAVEDFNLDGVADILKDTALNAPQYVAISYNNPANEGVMNLFDSFHTNQPYHTNTGDLNNDGRPDVVVTDDASDRYRVNTGTDAFGRATWGPSSTYDFLTGGDDGFGGNNLVVDLDLDGWNDVIITDVDVDISGCGRRTHFYHNHGGPIGTTNLTLLEERQSSGSGWIGVVGMNSSDLTGTHDVAVFDLNKDGYPDMLFGRCTGSFMWMNRGQSSDGPGTAQRPRGPIVVRR